MLMRAKSVGTFAALGSYALTGQAQLPTWSLPSHIPARPNVSLSNAASEWRAKQLVEEVKLEWQEARSATREAQNGELDEWEIAQALENADFAPSESSIPVRIEISEIRPGKPHRASMEEVDYELIESLRGEL